MYSIYYSRSNEVCDASVGACLQDFFERLPFQGGNNAELRRHEKGDGYCPEKLATADIVFVGVDDINDSGPEIGKGCYSEISRAHDEGIPIVVLTRCQATDRMMVQRIDRNDVDILDEDCWQKGYARILLYEEVEYAQSDGCPAAYVTCETTIQQMLYELHGEDRYREIFEKSYDTPVQEERNLEISDDDELCLLI